MAKPMDPKRAARLRRIARDTEAVAIALDRLRVDLTAEESLRIEGMDRPVSRMIDFENLQRIDFERVENRVSIACTRARRQLEEAGEPLRFERSKPAGTAAPATADDGPTLMQMYGGGAWDSEATDA